MNSYLEVAIEAAREAGGILLTELDRPVNISYKGDVDIVTQADKRSEQAIVTRLRTHFPKHAIVGEEGGAQSATSADTSGSKFTWYVDPLDGTTNFAHGFPWFCVSIGLAEGAPGKEELLAGVVYQPVTQELFTAAKGEGAYRNNKRIHVSKIDKLATSLLGTGFPAHKRAQNPNIHYYWNFTLRSHGVRRAGSAALDLASVACGRFDGFWEFGLNPWDTAAGVLLVREAGGTVTDFAGQPYQLGARELLASNTLIHAEMQALAADVERQSLSGAPK
ncbi:MAG TPA: inositol monophosphatase family protein [Candidatus Acidoferrum sp.]|nr:inositol monophosphatase family protein [Candidatus Acidoferrum sp.]